MTNNYNKMIDRSIFLSKRALNKEFVEVENGFGMYIQEMSGDDVEQLSKIASGDKKPTNVESLAIIIALCAVDEDNNKLFGLDDIKSIVDNNSITTISKLSDVAIKISKLNPNAVGEAKNNLKNDLIGNSTSI
jgi:hypothetical protein